MPNLERQEKILEPIRRLPEGFVTTYGDLCPEAPRLPGRVLALNTDKTLPWHRVVRALPPGPDGAPVPNSAAERELLAGFADAFELGDVDALVEFLSEDAWIRMPPEPHEYQGREAIAAFLRSRGIWDGGRWVKLVQTRANGQPAFAYYLEDRNAGVARIGGVFVLTVDGGSIGTCTRFGDTGMLPFFGLPRTLPA